MTDITINIEDAKEIAVALVGANQFSKAVPFLIAIHNSIAKSKSERATEKPKATPAAKKKRKHFTWSPERRAAAKARAQAKKEANQAASNGSVPLPYASFSS